MKATIDSTNTEAKRQAMAGAPEGLVVLAEEQTGGRGRLGRSFQSPRGCGLYLTAQVSVIVFSEDIHETEDILMRDIEVAIELMKMVQRMELTSGIQDP